jgi:hypothetical protein
MADRDSDSDHSHRVAAWRVARLMKPGEKSPVSVRQNGRSGPRPERLLVPALDVAAGQSSRPRARKEGRDERMMVGLAVALALIVAAATIYQMLAWARI